MPLTHIRFCTLDINVLRLRKELDQLLPAMKRDGIGFLLPDLALFELSNNNDVKSTWRQSLAYLAEHADIAYVAYNNLLAVEMELATGEPSPVIDTAGTVIFRELLQTIRSNDETRFDEALARMEQIVTVSRDPEREARHRRTMLKTVSMMRERVPASWLLSVRRGGATALAEILASWRGEKTIHDLLTHALGERSAALHLWTARSALAVWLEIVVAFGVLWTARSGLDSKPPADVARDIRDLEYIHAACRTGSLFSKEKNVNLIFDALEEARVIRLLDFDAVLPSSSALERW